VLFQYTESDKNFSPQVLEILQKSDYPFVEPEKRLIVLKWLCERLFETAIFKRIMKFGEIIEVYYKLN
jgi:hypothetical protein